MDGNVVQLPTPPKPLGVHKAIAEVMRQCATDGISKDRRNKHQGYDFRGIDDVYNSLAPMLANAGLIIIPRMLSHDGRDVDTFDKNGNPKKQHYVVVEGEFTLVCVEDGTSVVAKTYGEAFDAADKATNKAMSAAYKYFAFQTFCIPTEGDNDADAHTHERASAEPKQNDPIPPASRDIKKAEDARKAEQFAEGVETKILRAGTLEELDEIDRINLVNFQWLDRHFPDLANGIRTKFQARQSALQAQTISV